MYSMRTKINTKYMCSDSAEQIFLDNSVFSQKYSLKLCSYLKPNFKALVYVCFTVMLA